MDRIESEGTWAEVDALVDADLRGDTPTDTPIETSTDAEPSPTRGRTMAFELYKAIGAAISATATVVAAAAKDPNNDGIDLVIGNIAREFANASGRMPLDLSDAVAEPFSEIYAALSNARWEIDKFHEIADAFDDVLGNLPNDRTDIVIMLRAAQTLYEIAASRVTTVAVAYAHEALQGPRLKAAIVKELMNAGAKQTPAEKEAASDPRYTAHRDRLIALQNEKADRESDRTLAYTRLETLRQVCDVREHEIAATQAGDTVRVASTRFAVLPSDTGDAGWRIVETTPNVSDRNGGTLANALDRSNAEFIVAALNARDFVSRALAANVV